MSKKPSIKFIALIISCLLVVIMGFYIYSIRTKPKINFNSSITPSPIIESSIPEGYVEAAGSTSFILSQASLIGKKPAVKTLQANYCKPSLQAASGDYGLTDIVTSDNTWGGTLRINSATLSDTDSNGIKESTLLTAGKLAFDQDGVVVEGAVVDPRAQFKCIFATTAVYSLGDIGGLSGADAKCNSLSTTAGLSGTYKAYMWSGTNSPGSRMSQSTVPYKLPSGTQIASSWSSLTATGVTVTETNVAASLGCTFYLAWVGTSNSNCNGFSDTSSSYSTSEYKLTTGDPVTYTNSCSQWTCCSFTCNSITPVSSHIVCVEQ